MNVVNVISVSRCEDPELLSVRVITERKRWFHRKVHYRAATYTGAPWEGWSTEKGGWARGALLKILNATYTVAMQPSKISDNDARHAEPVNFHMSPPRASSRPRDVDHEAMAGLARMANAADQ